MITDLRSFLKVSCHTKFRFAEREAQCILGECGPLSSNDSNGIENVIKRKRIGYGDYFVIIASSLHPLLLTWQASNGLVEAPLKSIQRIKELRLCGHVVKILNLEISRCHLAVHVEESF